MKLSKILEATEKEILFREQQFFNRSTDRDLYAMSASGDVFTLPFRANATGYLRRAKGKRNG
jgi:hypothetical protein